MFTCFSSSWVGKKEKPNPAEELDALIKQLELVASSEIPIKPIPSSRRTEILLLLENAEPDDVQNLIALFTLKVDTITGLCQEIADSNDAQNIAEKQQLLQNTLREFFWIMVFLRDEGIMPTMMDATDMPKASNILALMQTVEYLANTELKNSAANITAARKKSRITELPTTFWCILNCAQDLEEYINTWISKHQQYSYSLRS